MQHKHAQLRLCSLKLLHAIAPTSYLYAKEPSSWMGP